ncbi:D-alanyl-D-alanine carboxypeptidase [Paenibacillaceae bacterium]|nr:D-alanyl-D-alanine carboxypeptidase [Paenibacillaceae bacterium]
MSFWLLLMVLTTAVHAEGEDNKGHVANELGLELRSAILMDADTGQILFEANAEVALPPASMSKMMTEFIVMEEIKSGKLKLDDIITVRENAATTTRQGSHVFLALNDKHTVEELLIAMAVGSANDASIALAEHISGTEEAFAKRMNQTAKDLGLETAHFINATGLSRNDLGEKYQPASIDGETIMSAKDSAMLAYYILKEHEDFLKYSSITKYKFRERDQGELTNINWMLEGNKESSALKGFAYEGMDGMKTGHTKQAKYCFTGTAKRGDMRLISVVMGTDSDKKRFYETAKLLDYGFDNFEKKTIVSSKETVESYETVKVKKGVDTSVPIVTQSDVSFLVKKGAPTTVTVSESSLKETDEVLAPIEAGAVVGTVTFKYTDEAGKELTKEVNLVTTEEVKKAGWFRLMFRGIKDFFVNLFNGIVDLF